MLGASQFMHFLCALPPNRQYGLWSFMSMSAKYFIEFAIFSFDAVVSKHIVPFLQLRHFELESKNQTKQFLWEKIQCKLIL